MGKFISLDSLNRVVSNLKNKIDTDLNLKIGLTETHKSAHKLENARGIEFVSDVTNSIVYFDGGYDIELDCNDIGLVGKLEFDYELFNKVSFVFNKGLTTNNFGWGDILKLKGIELGANAYEHKDTHSPGDIDETPMFRFVSIEDKDIYYDKYTKNELDSAISNITSGMYWLTPVPTFDDITSTYPDALDGYAVNVLDDDKTYRYDGEHWIELSVTHIPNASETIDGAMNSYEFNKLNDIEAGANHYTHPEYHDASILDDSVYSMVSDLDKSVWSDKASREDVNTAILKKMDSSSILDVSLIDDLYNEIYAEPSDILYMETVDTFAEYSFSGFLDSYKKLVFNGEEVDVIPAYTSGIVEIHDAKLCEDGSILNCAGIRKIWGKLDTTGVESVYGMFNMGRAYLEEIDISEWDLSEVVDCRAMFASCSKLVSLKIGGSLAPIYVDSMFEGCTSLVEIDMFGVELSGIISAVNMFASCSSLESIKYTGSMSLLRNSSSMFIRCASMRNVPYDMIRDARIEIATNMFRGSGIGSFNIEELSYKGMNDISYMFDSCSNLSTVILDGLTHVSNGIRLFSDATSLVSVSMRYCDCTNASFDSSFYSCNSLVSVDLSNSKFGDTNRMFAWCRSLSEVIASDVDTSFTSTMSEMFSNCTSLTSLDLSSFTTESLTMMSDMFKGCSSISSIDMSNMICDSVIYMSGVFSGCSSLINLNLSKLKASQVQTLDSLFANCERMSVIDVTGINFDTATSTMHMFYNCGNASSIVLPSFVGSRISNSMNMFRGCRSLLSLNMSKASLSSQNISNMFDGCSSLIELDLSSFSPSIAHGNWTNQVFTGCVNLRTLKIGSMNTLNSSYTKLSGWFYQCYSLNSIDMYGQYITSNGVGNLCKDFATWNPDQALTVRVYGASAVPTLTVPHNITFRTY